jgi:hypothetical protein
VPRCLERLQPHSPEIDDVAVVEWRESVLGSCDGAQVNRRPDAIAQLDVASDEIGVEMCEEHVRDPQPMLFGKRQVLIDVTLRVDDSGPPGQFVADEIRRMRETVEIELLEKHCISFEWLAVAASLDS